MNKGEFLTQITIWASLAGYALGAAYLLSRGSRRWESAARWAWTAGCLCLIVHAALAFNYYHSWSHSAAYVETARQTAEVFRIYWGGGLFINYMLILAWLADVVWWWARPESHRNRPRIIDRIWQGFLLFIIFNATVVFKDGVLRWIGLILCAGLILIWWRGRRPVRLPLVTD